MPCSARRFEHSLSPALHRAAYAHLGLNWTYDRVEIDELRLALFVRGSTLPGAASA